MSMHPQQDFTIPEETVRVVQAAFPNGNRYIKMREVFGSLFQDELFSTRGQPAAAPWRLALITLMQFMENLTDRQAAQAVRARIDWKYALGLSLEDPGVDFSVLSEFRTRLVAGGAEERLLNSLLEIGQEQGWLQSRTRQRTDSTHIVASVRELTRLELVGETLLQALNVLAQVVPVWLRQKVPSAWFVRYSQRFSDYRLPRKEKERQALAETIGQDGYQLLEWVYAEETFAQLRTLPAVEALRQVWVQQFFIKKDQVRWRKKGNFPPAAQMISSPYDLESRYSYKRGLTWRGYKVHLTETCGTEGPHLITHVETTVATEPDFNLITPIHQALADKNLLPDQHLVDKGYVSSGALVESAQHYGVDLFGPIADDPSWQARDERAYDATYFNIDWAQQQVTCPQGRVSQTWTPANNNRGQPIILVGFDPHTCTPCPVRTQCTKSKKGVRKLSIQPQERHEAQRKARARQQTQAFKEVYALRSGVEGTVSQAVNEMGMRRTRYRGLAKTHLQNLITAAAINLSRMLNWIQEKPRSKTYRSPFSMLAPA